MPIEFNYELLEDRVAILPETLDNKTSEGLFTGNARMSNRGTVVGVGLGLKATETGVRIPLDVKVGYKVIFTPHEFEPFEQFILGRESGIKCITQKT